MDGWMDGWMGEWVSGFALDCIIRNDGRKSAKDHEFNQVG